MMIVKNIYGICILLCIVSFGTNNVIADDKTMLSEAPTAASPSDDKTSSDGNDLINNNKAIMDDMVLKMKNQTEIAGSDDYKNAMKLKIENEKLKETVTELSLQMAKVTGDLKLEILDYVEKVDSLNSEIRNLREQLKTSQTQYEEQLNQCHSMKNNISDYEKKYSDLNDTSNSKDEQIKKISDELIAKDTELEEIKKELDCRKMENCALAQVASEKRTQLNKCSQELALLKQELNKCRDNYCVLEDKFIHNVTPEVKVCLNEGIIRSRDNVHEAIRAEHAYSQSNKCQCTCPAPPKCSNEDSIILKKVVELVGKKFKCKCDTKKSPEEEVPELPEGAVPPAEQEKKKAPCFTFRPSMPERPESIKCNEQSIVVVTNDEGPKSAYYVANPKDLPKDCVSLKVKKFTPPPKEKIITRLPPCIYVPGAPEAEKYKSNKITITGFDCVQFDSLTIQWEKIQYQVKLFGDNKKTLIENFKVWVNGNVDAAIEIESGRLQSILLHADPKSLLPVYIMVDENQPSNSGPNTEVAFIDPSSNVVYTSDRIYLMKKPIFNYILPNQVSLIISGDVDQTIVFRSVVVDPLSIRYFLEELVKQPDYAICINRPWWSNTVSNPNLSSRTFKKISIIKNITNPEPVIHGGPLLGDDHDTGNNKLTNLIIDQPAMRLTASYIDDPSVTIDCRLPDKSDIEIFKMIKDVVKTLPIKIIGE